MPQPGSLSRLLEQRREQQLYRRRRILDGAKGPVLQGKDGPLLSFCSNDYLGLATHPRLARAMKRAIDDYGSGAGAAHLVSGHRRIHQQLEEALAALTGYPRALLFSTGYMANLGVISSLTGRGDRVFQDRLNHASLLDGALLSGARLQRYRHADSEHLHTLLADDSERTRLVASDGVFSMDGDLAPLPAIAPLCRQHRAWLLVDDAHGIGVLGRDGGGTLQHFQDRGELDCREQKPILMATLGKALGVFGAFVAADEDVVEYLIQTARSYVYTTALPPALAAAALEALQLCREEAWRRQRLQELITYFRRQAAAAGLALMPSATAIQPLPVAASNTQSDRQRAMAMSTALEARGLLVPAIRPPTVPEGGSRLRITLCAEHSEAQIDRLIEELAVLQ